MAGGTPLGAALYYAGKGWAVFPCHSVDKDGTCSCGNSKCSNKGKHPRTPHGLKDATTDKEQIRAWWQKWPDANVAIATGSASGIFVIDVDTYRGGDVGFGILTSRNKLPDAPLSLTGGGGQQYFIKLPDEGKVKNAVDLAEGVDMRGEGGYVIVPPSSHASGRNYEWDAESSPKQIDPPACPAWLAELLIDKPTQKPKKKERPAEDVLKGVPQGKRDATLFRYACSLRERGASQAEAIELVRVAAMNCSPPFPLEEGEDYDERRVMDAVRAKVEHVYTTYKSKLERAVQGAATSQKVNVDADDRTVRVDWPELNIRAVATSLKEHSRDGDITGYLTISASLPAGQKDLHAAKFNFVASRTRSEWANYLHKRVPDVQWAQMLERLCGIVVDHMHTGEPTVNIGEEEVVKPPEYVLHPLIQVAQPTILFGAPGTAKSYVAALVSSLIASGQEALNFHSDRQALNPLYLDWEGDRASLASRITLLRRGLGLPPLSVWYRHCIRPLASDVDKIRQQVVEGGHQFVVIDSLGPACGGNFVSDTEPPLNFFAALRCLKCSSLVIAHAPKNPEGDSTVFGSVYFTALSRSIWRIGREQDAGEDEARIWLTHTKTNYSKHERPFGFTFRFNEDSTEVKSISLGEIADADPDRSLTDLILEILKDAPAAMTTKEIADAIDRPTPTVRRVLHRMAQKNLVAKPTRTHWGALLRHGEEPEGPTPF